MFPVVSVTDQIGSDVGTDFKTFRLLSFSVLEDIFCFSIECSIFAKDGFFSFQPSMV